MLNKSLFSSASSEWETPQWLFDELNAQIPFDLDPCATAENAKCPKFYTRDQDGLKQPWHGNVFVNPPYGRGIGEWVHKAWREAASNADIVVMLLPARTDTAWWHSWEKYAEQTLFIRGRLKFGGSKNSAPFPSCIMVFAPNAQFQPFEPIDARGRG